MIGVLFLSWCSQLTADGMGWEWALRRFQIVSKFRETSERLDKQVVTSWCYAFVMIRVSWYSKDGDDLQGWKVFFDNISSSLEVLFSLIFQLFIISLRFRTSPDNHELSDDCNLFWSSWKPSTSQCPSEDFDPFSYWESHSMVLVNIQDLAWYDQMDKQ